jgi:chemotaxis protein CheD
MQANTLMDPLTFARARGYVQPGQILVSARPTQVTTILGSCVAVCMWDMERRIGGVNHFMLPMLAGPSGASPRFGNVAMNELIRQLLAAGARLPFLRAHVFGGACMFDQMQSAGHLGEKNAEFALQSLRNLAVNVERVETGGKRGRKVQFNTDEGTACVTMI